MTKNSYFLLPKLWLLSFIFSLNLNSQNLSNKQVFEMTQSLKKPAYLKVGDTVAIVATAGIIKEKEPIEKAVALMESWGLHVLTGKHIFEDNNHFAGTDTQRLNDFQEALDDKTVKAIWSARGGYGTVRIIDDINFTEFQKNPKWIVGYSDITVLHSHIHNLGVETLHAMMGMSMKIEKEKREESIQTLKKALFGETLNYDIPASKYNKIGNTSGQLIGGNLSILQSLLGSPSSISTKGKILFFEEIGEYLYHIDRMVQALKRSGYFKHCKGLIIGGMTDIKQNTTPFGQTVEELILEATKEYDFPILFDFPAGHDDENRAMYLGREIKMSVGKEKSMVQFKN